jgi:hypothetical protein
MRWLVALSRSNPPAPTDEPSCTTACPWGMGGLKCFKKKKKQKNFNPPSLDNGLWLCRVATPPPPRRSRRPRRPLRGGGGVATWWEKIKIKISLTWQWLVALSHFNPPAPTEEPLCTTGRRLLRGGGGIEMFEEILFFIFYFLFFNIFFQKNFNPPSPDRAVCTTAPPWGRGDWNAVELSTKFFYFFCFLLETFQSLLKHGASCWCHPRSIEIRLSTAERRWVLAHKVVDIFSFLSHPNTLEGRLKLLSS